MNVNSCNVQPDEENCSDNDENEYSNETIKSPKKVLRANSLFQTMFYIVNNGRKKTPLQVMQGHAIYEKSKSKELITANNNLGYCISYPELTKLRNKLSAYTMYRSMHYFIPIPQYQVILT